MKIETYHSANAPAERAWRAYVVSGNHVFGISFPASTEELASQAADKWWKAELERQSKFVTPAEVSQHSAEIWNSSAKRDLRGQGFVGKVWMFDPGTQKRARVDADEVESYEGHGWIKRGPRG